MPTLKQTLADLKGKRTNYSIALDYAMLKDGELPSPRKDKYERAVNRIFQNPETAQFDSLARVFKILGVDIEAAIVIAASQAKSKPLAE